MLIRRKITMKKIFLMIFCVYMCSGIVSYAAPSAKKAAKSAKTKAKIKTKAIPAYKFVKRKLPSGTAVAAEITTAETKAVKLDKFTWPNLVKGRKRAYAVVTMKIAPGRSIGIYDYILRDKAGKEYPCVAFRAPGGQFTDAWQLLKSEPNRNYQLLFIVPNPGKGNPVLTVEYKLGKNDWKPVKLTFLNLNGKPFNFLENKSAK